MKTSRTRLAVVSGLAVVATAGLIWRSWSGTATPLGVVIITLDTTRMDRLSPYGFMDVTLPHIERLAREGVVFDQATSVAPLTLPVHTSLFTGLLPPNHGVRDNADPALAEAETTLAETLLARGFRTGAFVGSIVLDPDRGLKQGFEQYRGVGGTDRQSPESRQRRANEVVDDAIQWLDTLGGSPFFLWAHLYDPHRPYDPPEPYRTTYGHNLYVGEIAFADSQIGRLVQALEQRHLLDRVVVIVTADHGESLGERGERDHGVFIYENVIRVPLIVRWPALAPSRVGNVVRLTDLMPTVLDLLNVPAPPGDGASLVDVMRGHAAARDLEAYSESLYPERLGWSPLRALREGRFKLIVAPRPELYDLDRDPFEEQNIYGSRRALADKMTTRAAELAKGRGTAASTARQNSVTPELQARLAALGYVASAAPRRAGESASLPDPKDCLVPQTALNEPPRAASGCGHLRPGGALSPGASVRAPR